MNQLTAILLGLVLIVAASVWSGYEWGHGSRDGEVAALGASLSAQTARADGEVATLRSLRATLKQERVKHARLRAAADEELAARAARIKALTLAASRRQTDLKKKAEADEDCAPLRNLPVCQPVADRLWGDAATSRPH